MTPEQILDAVRPAIVKLARKAAARAGRPDLADDLEQSAAMRICRHARQYDPARGKPYTWAALHIAGAIADAMRREDPVPRLTRQRANAGTAWAPETHSIDAVMFPDRDGRPRPLRDWLAAPAPAADGGAKETLAGGIAVLSARGWKAEARAVRLYAGGMSMKAVGVRMGLGESRVSQMITQAVRVLRLAWNSPLAGTPVRVDARGGQARTAVPS